MPSVSHETNKRIIQAIGGKSLGGITWQLSFPDMQPFIMRPEGDTWRIENTLIGPMPPSPTVTTLQDLMNYVAQRSRAEALQYAQMRFTALFSGAINIL
jgi:hypothetical protein